MSTLDAFRIVRKTLTDELRRHNLTVRAVGVKREDLEEPLNQSTGYWENPSHVASKPPRWIVHFEQRDGNTVATIPDPKTYPAARTVGYINNGNGDCSAVVIRIFGLLRDASQSFAVPNWEWLMILAFDQTLEAGTSSETLSNFDVEHGCVTYQGKVHAVASIHLVTVPPEDGSTHGAVSYPEATDALLRRLQSPTMDVHLYDSHDAGFEEALASNIRQVMDQMGAAIARAIPPLEPKSDLIGVPEDVYHRITAALRAGKRHIILYGPPGTGKTTLAQYVAQELSASGEFAMLTAVCHEGDRPASRPEPNCTER